MHVNGFTLDLNWFSQFIATAVIVVFGLLYLVKNTASKYFAIDDANFDSSSSSSSSSDRSSTQLVSASIPIMPGVISSLDPCAVCGNSTTKHCAGCKLVRYCSEACQRSHWRSGHKAKCKDIQLSGKVNYQARTNHTAVPLVLAHRTSKSLKLSKEILFPYDEFVELFNWDRPGFPPCGLLNVGNSCFANVVLQCLACTRPLVAYLLEKGHRRKCRRTDWCFLCELQIHVERACQSIHAFSPINILSRLPNIGGNLGYGKQEDAHEFMRFAIDTMQSVCLDEFGGEKAVHPSSQETTLIQHIFGGHLRSQVICTKCKNVSNQFENMMDLTVEIQGHVESLEDCLNQFTTQEWLHGDNMYKCDGCNDYVLAWKRLTIHLPPNILTIALKRFQSGRFGKLNKKVTFPETLDLSPYRSEAGDGNDLYKLYAVVVHVDMLNASFFGHYICYTKDFSGNWYRIDDCKVTSVELDEVLSQGAYMLFYGRVCPRRSCLNPIEDRLCQEKHKMSDLSKELCPCPKQSAECFSLAESVDSAGKLGSLPFDSTSQAKVSTFGAELSSTTLDIREDLDGIDLKTISSVPKDIEAHDDGCIDSAVDTTSPDEHICALVSKDTSLTDAHFSEAPFIPECQLLLPVSDFENHDASDKIFAAECLVTDTLINGSISTQNCDVEKGETAQSTFFPTSNMSEEVHQMDSMNRGKPEKAKFGNGMPPSSIMEDAVGKLDRINSPVPKLKPLFQPGFLGKRPRNKYNKQDGKAPAEVGDLGFACNLIDQDHGFFKPGCSSHENGGKNGEDKLRLEYNVSTPSQKGKEFGESKSEGEMLTSKSLDISNGNSDVSAISDGRIIT